MTKAKRHWTVSVNGAIFSAYNKSEARVMALHHLERGEDVHVFLNGREVVVYSVRMGGILRVSLSGPNGGTQYVDELPRPQRRTEMTDEILDIDGDDDTPLVGETKEDRFLRMVNKRLPKTIKSIRLMKNLANRHNYSYTGHQAVQVMEALQKEMDALEQALSTGDEGDDIPIIT